MRRMRLPLIAILALAGCAPTGPSGTDAYLSKVKTVGVASLIGDTFYESRMGITVFGNSSFSAPVPDWKIEQFAQERASALLRSHGGFKTVRLERGGSASEDLLRDRRRLLLDLARKQGIDALVAIAPSSMMLAPRVGIGPGYGIFDNDSLKGPKRCVYVLYEIELLDVATGQPKDRQAVRADCHGTDGLGDQEIAFHDSMDGYTDAEKAKIRHILEVRLSNSLREALAGMQLF